MKIDRRYARCRFSGVAKRLKGTIILVTIVIAITATAVGFVSQPFVAPLASRPPAVDPVRLEAHVKYLSTELYPRSFEQLGNTELAAEYIRNAFEHSGAIMDVQQVTVEEAEYKNIIGRFGPKSDSQLVIGAHYDSYGDASEGAKYPSGYDATTHTPGADDNASGIAALLELARLFHKNPPSRPVTLVAYATEEPPHFRTEHMGSAWHARASAKAGFNVDLMLSLEMIGYYRDEAESQSYPVPGMDLIYPDRGNFIALVGRLDDYRATRRVKSIMQGATDLPVYSINALPLVTGIDFSDHLNYWAEGYPAIMVTDTAFYRNPNYHEAGDTYKTLDYGRMAKVVQSIYAVAQLY